MALCKTEWLVSGIAQSLALTIAERGTYSESNCYQLKQRVSAQVEI